MLEKQTVKLACPDCGSEMLNLPDGFDFETNFTDVTCADCGREITKTDAINQGLGVVKAQVDDMFRDVFKGTGWKLK